MTATRGIPLEGDRGAFDTLTHPDMHALDLKEGTPIYHWTEAQMEALFVRLDGTNQASWIPNPTGDATQDISGSLNIIGGGTGEIYSHYLQQAGYHVISLGQTGSGQEYTWATNVIIGRGANAYADAASSVIAGLNAGENVKAYGSTIVGAYAAQCDVVPEYTNLSGTIVIGNSAAENVVELDTCIVIGDYDTGAEANVSAAVIVGLGAGYQAGAYAASQPENLIAIGTYAGWAAGGDDSIYIGNEAGEYANYESANWTQSESIGIGLQAFYNGTGYGNIALGSYVMDSAVGDYNIGIGEFTLDAVEGSDNVAIGEYSFTSTAREMHGAVALGSMAGEYATSSYGIFIGYRSGAYETNDERLYISNDDSPLPLIYGEFDTPRLRIGGDLEVLNPSVLEPEVLTETDFAIHANWSVTGDFDDSGGSATFTRSSGAGTLTQASAAFATPLVPGAWYAFTYTFTLIASLQWRITTLQITTATAESAVDLPKVNGVNTVYFKAATAPTNFVISATASSATPAPSFSLDNVSLRQIEGGGTVRAHGGFYHRQSQVAVSDPPTYAELTSTFGSPPTLGRGFMALVDSGGAGTDQYIVWTTSDSWWYAKGTEIVGPSSSASESASQSPSASESASASSSSSASSSTSGSASESASGSASTSPSASASSSESASPSPSEEA